MFIILIENVWTGSVTVYPKLINDLEELSLELNALEAKCSKTGSIKNNKYSYGLISRPEN